MAARCNLWIGFLHKPILANDERAAQQPRDHLSIALLFTPCAVSFDHLAVGVRKKRELEREFLGKCQV